MLFVSRKSFIHLHYDSILPYGDMGNIVDTSDLFSVRFCGVGYVYAAYADFAVYGSRFLVEFRRKL